MGERANGREEALLSGSRAHEDCGSGAMPEWVRLPLTKPSRCGKDRRGEERGSLKNHRMRRLSGFFRQLSLSSASASQRGKSCSDLCDQSTAAKDVIPAASSVDHPRPTACDKGVVDADDILLDSTEREQVPLDLHMLLSHFGVLEHLASGSMCDVFLARHEGKKIVIKTLLQKAPKNAEHDLTSEMLLLGSLNHPNIIQIEGAGKTEEGVRFLALEHLELGSLADLLKKRRVGWKMGTSLHCMRQLASALQYLHDHALTGHTVIHRDLKPCNIALTAGGTYKLLDFGLAKVLKRRDDGEGTEDGYRMTGERGTPRYMSPEVALNQKYTEKVDTYSFSLIFWELLSQRRPFHTMNVKSFRDQVVLKHKRPMIPASWDDELRQLLTVCWDKDYRNRLPFREIVPMLESMQDRLGTKGQRRESFLRSLFPQP
ncbi:unnamed protein product [Chrysoparadoxa australica]